MKPTKIVDPNYFHKVVDCQWACPAHTPVPEYIRLLAEEKYTEAYIDVISPCVAFNNHVGSTKSYEFTRNHLDTAVNADLILTSPEVTADYEEGAREDVAMPDGSTLRLYKLDADYDPHDRAGALNYVQEMQEEGTVVTGLLYVDTDSVECHSIMATVKTPLAELSEKELCPVGKVLESINESFR